jgi:hypothetical protein
VRRGQDTDGWRVFGGKWMINTVPDEMLREKNTVPDEKTSGSSRVQGHANGPGSVGR